MAGKDKDAHALAAIAITYLKRAQARAPLAGVPRLLRMRDATHSCAPAALGRLLPHV